ncbi:enoyl-CoA hydratase [Peribacillus cavernae]|uniref:Enoyl-CoA hydratase n=1 Tax=Peribacillus cavernae TaxID=1674310 RepID=A0A3S0UEY5_9BACI|nr:enoyl-CoA hydratase-related protein [Peribacillus cavernae]MDQ0217586.1 enoyl-CoA hydratase/carnithine racemase [Peribacillus cavernae]RUQ29982.1 enoyl-CoA hydratase [Peribacillus cavernae]
MPSILYEVHSKIAHITLNGGGTLNLLNTATVQKLHDVMKDISNNPQVSVVIISGAGHRAFCAGADVKDVTFQSPATLVQLTQQLGELFDVIEDLPQPTIAAINGFAFGAGFELSLACDLRIAVDQTLLGLTETRIGLIPGAGGTQRLPRLIGESRALELILTAKRITSLEAYQYGILTKVVPNNKLEEEAYDLAHLILNNAPIAVQQAKLAVKNGMKTDLGTGLELEKAGFLKTVSTEDRDEGLAAFLEKKQPDFTGK